MTDLKRLPTMSRGQRVFIPFIGRGVINVWAWTDKEVELPAPTPELRAYLQRLREAVPA